MALSLTCSASALAAEPPTRPKAPRETYPLYGKVVTINPQFLVIQGGKGKPDRTFAITSGTTISKDTSPANIREVIPGQWVGGLIRKTPTGHHLLEKLNLSVKQKP